MKGFLIWLPIDGTKSLTIIKVGNFDSFLFLLGICF